MTTRRTRVQGIGFSIEAEDLRKAAEALDAASRGRLMEEVGRALQPTGQVLAGKVRAATRRIPSWGLYGTSVRSTIASNVEARSGAGDRGAWVRIMVNPVGLPHGLAEAMDTDARRQVPGHGYTYGFRHPVYGHRDRWVNQATYPYFRRTLRNQKKVTDAAIRDIVRRFVEQVAADSK